MEEHRKNKEMFKSSIEGQSQMKFSATFSQMPSEKPFPFVLSKKRESQKNTPAKVDQSQGK